MPIPSDNLIKLRETDHTIRVKVNAFPAQIVAIARLSAAPLAYPIGSLYVTDTVNWDQVRVGQLFRIVDDDDNVITHGVVRLPPTSNTLYIDGKSRGDPGYAIRYVRALEAGQRVEIYSYQPLWSLLSRIKDGSYYKKFDIPYDGSGSNPSPVANLGAWRVLDADESTNRAQVTFDNDLSFTWAGKSITSYLWTIPDSATIVAGTATSDSITISLPPGFHIVRCRITDSGGAWQESFRPVIVNHPVHYPALSDKYGIVIENDSQDQQGRQMTIKLYGDIDTSDLILRGGAYIVTEEALYNGQPLDEGIGVTTYVGFSSVNTVLYDELNGEKSLTLELKSPYHRMEEMAMVSQAIMENPNPENWTQVGIGLGYPDFIGWYILKHHSTFLDMFDYHPLRETPRARKRNWGLNGSTLAEYLMQVAKSVAGNIGCTSDGSLYLRRNPNLEETPYRNALDERMTWTPDDLTENPEVPENLMPTVGQLKAFAFVYQEGATDEQEQAAAVASIAYGYVQGQGAGKQDEETIVLPNDEPQDRINRIAGHMIAQANNPTPEVVLKVNRNMDVAEPALMLWHRLDIPAEYSPTGEALRGRTLIKSVDRSWDIGDSGAATKDITHTHITESYGQPGETFDLSQQATIYPPEQPPVDETFGFMVAWNSNRRLGRTFDGVRWRLIMSGITGGVNDADFDWHSSYVRSGYTNGFLGAWCVTTDGNTLRIYYTTDIMANGVSWTLQASYEMEDSTVVRSARIACSPTERDYAACAWRDRKGTKIVRTIDGGDTWSEPLLVGVSTTDSSHDDYDIGLAIDGEITVVTAQHAAGDYRPYVATSKTGSFSVVANAPLVGGMFSNQPNPMIYLDPVDGCLYVGRVIESYVYDPASKQIELYNPLNAINPGFYTNFTIHKEQTGTLPGGHTYPNENAFLFQMKRDAIEDGEATLDVGARTASHLSAKIDLGGTKPKCAIVALASAEDGDDIPVQAVPVNYDPRRFGEDWYSNGQQAAWHEHYFHLQCHGDRFSGAIPSTESEWRLRYKIRLTPEVIANYTVNYLSWQVWMVIRGFASSLQGTSQSALAASIPAEWRDLEWKTQARLYRRNNPNDPVWESPLLTFYTNDSPLSYEITSGYWDNTLHIYKTITPTFNISPAIDNVAYIEVDVYSSDVVPNGELTIGPVFSRDGIDRFSMRLTPITVGYDEIHYESYALYRVANYTSGSPTWTDITPQDTALPMFPYSFVLDAGRPRYPVMLGHNGDGIYFYASENAAQTWEATVDPLPYIGLKKAGAVAVFFGEDALDVTEDNGITIYDLRGDWSAAIGSIGTFRGVLTLL